MTGRWGDGASAPLPDGAPADLVGFVAGRQSRARIDTADLGWLGGPGVPAPLVEIRPGTSANAVTLSVGWGVRAIPSPEVFLVIVHGRLKVDSRQLQSPLRTRFDEWVHDFNQSLQANNLQLMSFATDGTILEVTSRVTPVGSMAPAGGLGAFALLAGAAAMPRPTGGFGGPGGTSPGPEIVPKPWPPTKVIPLIFVICTCFVVIAWWTIGGDDGPMTGPSSSAATTATTSVGPPVDPNPITSQDTTTTPPAGSGPGTSDDADADPSGEKNGRERCVYPPTQQPVKCPDKAAGVDAPSRPGGQTPSVEDPTLPVGQSAGAPDIGGAIPSTGAETWAVLRIATLLLVAGLMALIAARLRRERARDLEGS